MAISLPINQKKISVVMNIFMVLLVIVSIILTIVESMSDVMTPQLAQMFLSIHTVILIVFFAELLYRFWQAPQKDARFTPAHARLKFISHPLTIIDIIVIAPLFVMLWTHNLHDADFVILRILRFTSMLNVFRFYRNSQIVRMFRRLSYAVWYEILIFLIISAQIILITGVAFYSVEHGVNPHIHDIPDGIWWSIITMTTIGYGDIYPYTTIGRIIGSVLGIVGIGFIALPTSILASGFVKALKEDKEILSISEDVEDISRDTEKLDDRLKRIEKILVEKLK